jgi:hypothetical protein
LPEVYASRSNHIAVRRTRGHQLLSLIRLVSPGDKADRNRMEALMNSAVALLRRGIHLLVVDLFPSGNHDPQGLHRLVWDEFTESDFELPPDHPLCLAAYIGGRVPEVFINPAAVGAELPDMPLFLSPDIYVPVPLEATYQSAWEAVPSFWRDVVTGRLTP